MNSGAKRWAATVRTLLAGCAVTTLAAIVGCGPRVDDADAISASSSAAPSILLRVTDAAGYQETLAGLRGKVVLVDFWATWCAPCIELFPHTVELHRKYEDRGLAVIAISLDDPEAAPQVRDFLVRNDARFDNLLSEYGSGVKALNAFGLSRGVPCFRLYDRSGQLHREFVVDPRADRQYTPADIEAAIAALL